MGGKEKKIMMFAYHLAVFSSPVFGSTNKERVNDLHSVFNGKLLPATAWKVKEVLKLLHSRR
jgi:hypothetical protein